MYIYIYIYIYIMSVSPNYFFYANPYYVDGSNSIINYANLTNNTTIQSNTNSESNTTTPDLEVIWDGNTLSNVVDGQTLGWGWPINGDNAALAGINLPMIGTTTWQGGDLPFVTAEFNVRTKVWMVHGHHTNSAGSRQTPHYVDTTGWTEVGLYDVISPANHDYDPETYEWGRDLIAWKIYEPGTYTEEFDQYSAHYFFEAAPEPEPEPSVDNVDLSENILSKYARGFFFSPNYNKQFFDAINWANNLGDYKTQLNLINPYNDNVLTNLDDTISAQLIISNYIEMNHINGSGGGFGGWSLSSNADGTIVAISSPLTNVHRGSVRVYKYDNINEDWNQIGSTINGVDAEDQTGRSISLNADGNILAIGVPRDDGPTNNLSRVGKVLIYDYVETRNPQWLQLGNDIGGKQGAEDTGYSVSLSADGTIVAIGAFANSNDNGTAAGCVRVYKYFNPNDAVDNYNDHKYFGVIPTSKSTNTYWAYYSFRIQQSGVDIIYFNASNNNNKIWNSSTRPSGPHNWGWQYNPSQSWTNTATPLWYVKTDATINGTSLTFELINYDQNHSPLSGNFVSSSSPNGPWVVRNGWFLNTPLTGVSPTPSAGDIITSDLNKKWLQLGDDILGETGSNHLGQSVSLSADGTIVAAGSIYNDGGGKGSSTGHVRVYKWNDSAWNQLGDDIDGEAASDYSGWSISLSDDGTILAIGAIYNDGGGPNSGHTRVYDYVQGRSPKEWEQLGTDIDGEGAGDVCGHSVSLNADGTILAIGSPYNNNYNGHARVYQYIDNDWDEVIDNIDGEASGYFGSRVSLSKTGSILFVGAPNENSGRVYTYKLIE